MLRISQGVHLGPPPPLAGMLAACHAGAVLVLDPVGAGLRWGGEGELWVHLDPGWGPERLRGLEGEAIFFGPGLHGAEERLRQQVPSSTLRPGGLELFAEDLAGLPITTWAGFDLPRGGPIRVLAGSGAGPRPLAALMREIVYLVETHATGLLLFDDADLAAWPGWLDAFEAACRHLPWDLAWEGHGAARAAVAPAG